MIETDIYIYMNTDDSLENFQKQLDSSSINFVNRRIYVETSRDLLVYHKLKSLVEKEGGLLIVQSLDAICHGKEEYVSALNELITSSVRLIILDYPVMLTKIDLESNHLFLKLLMEVYAKPKKKLIDLRAAKSQHLGRRKIQYPDNWDTLYRQWEKKEISGKDFME